MDRNFATVLIQFKVGIFIIVILIVLAGLMRLGWIDMAFLDWAADRGIEGLEVLKKSIGGGTP